MRLERVHFYTGQIIDNYIYASQSFYNGLIKIDVNTNATSFIGMFPNEKAVTSVLHRFSYLYKNKIFFIPCDAKNVSVFDIDKQSITPISINNSYNGGSGQKCFFVQDNHLWLIPVSGSGNLVVVNMDDYSVTVRESANTIFGGSTITNICQDDKWVYFARGGDNKVIKYDIENGNTYEIESSVSGPHSVSKGRDGVWIMNEKNDSIVFVNEKKETAYMIKEKKYDLLLNVIDYKDGVYALPHKLENFLRKEKSDYFEEVDITSLGIKRYYGYQGAFSYDLIESQDTWYLPPYNVDKMVTIDKKSGCIGARKLFFDAPVDIPNEEIKKAVSSGVSSEGMPIDLKTFMEII